MNELKVFQNSEFGNLGIMLIDGKPCYMIPVSSLPDDLKSRYYGRLKKETGIMTEPVQEPAQAKKAKVKRILNFEDCTEEQRRTINTWTSILNEWQRQRVFDL